MSESKHTPGPWKESLRNDGTRYIVAKYSSRVPIRIARVLGGFTKGDPGAELAHANAELIAAAPETARQRDEAWAANVQDRLSIIELTCQRDVLVEAASLKRNVIIHDEHGFEGEWVAVPREDFDLLRAAIADAKK